MGYQGGVAGSTVHRTEPAFGDEHASPEDADGYSKLTLLGKFFGTRHTDNVWRSIWLLRFQPQLEAEFEIANAEQRRLSIMTMAVFMLVAAQIAAAGFYCILTDVRCLLMCGMLLINIMGIVGLTIIAMRPPVWLRESVVLLCAFGWAAMAIVLGFATRTDGLWIIQITIALHPFVLTTVLQCRFSYGIIGCILLPPLACLPNLFLSPHESQALVAMITVQFLGGLYALVAGYKLEYRERGNFLAMLREREQARKIRDTSEELDRLSRTDPLTDLLNRRGVEAKMSALFSVPNLSDGVGVMIIDVDHFKLYNDRYGHSAGDMCLRRIAETMRASVEGVADLVGRWGGEEFIIAGQFGSEGACRDLAERIRRNIESLAIEHAESSTAGVVTASIGLSCSCFETSPTSASLVADADAALYEAKRGGRNRTCTSTHQASAQSSFEI